MSDIEDIIAVIENLNYIEKIYYDLQTLISKKEFHIEVDEKSIDSLKNRLKSHYAFIPYDLSVIQNNSRYSTIQHKLENYQYKIPRLLQNKF